EETNPISEQRTEMALRNSWFMQHVRNLDYSHSSYQSTQVKLGPSELVAVVTQNKPALSYTSQPTNTVSFLSTSCSYQYSGNNRGNLTT
ncbi:MAG TPA: hypothetical protein VFK94_01410, partial [Patescibacteria group bacterium]|nr:hypothetical protein [Patescibacteria group bacterium]